MSAATISFMVVPRIHPARAARRVRIASDARGRCHPHALNAASVDMTKLTCKTD